MSTYSTAQQPLIDGLLEYHFITVSVTSQVEVIGDFSFTFFQMKMIIYENFKSRNIPRQKKEKEMMINGHGYG